ncbi:MAG: hypothetical protein AMS27_09090 [Bacteroides sp. SM23_62_1]|nr:MAG: hypothetical protein AMS27_09090 [Bacteroides sp. SM23_62_1]
MLGQEPVIQYFGMMAVNFEDNCSTHKFLIFTPNHSPMREGDTGGEYIKIIIIFCYLVVQFVKSLNIPLYLSSNSQGITASEMLSNNKFFQKMQPFSLSLYLIHTHLIPAIFSVSITGFN